MGLSCACLRLWSWLTGVSTRRHKLKHCYARRAHARGSTVSSEQGRDISLGCEIGLIRHKAIQTWRIVKLSQSWRILLIKIRMSHLYSFLTVFLNPHRPCEFSWNIIMKGKWLVKRHYPWVPGTSAGPFAMFLRRVCVKILGWLERVTWGRWEVAGRLDSLQFKPREACQPCHLPPNHEVYKPWTLTTAPPPSIQWLWATGIISTAFALVCKYLVLAQTQLSLEFYSSAFADICLNRKWFHPKASQIVFFAFLQALYFFCCCT